jgi:hypothetical protein
VLLGKGKRLFERIPATELEGTTVVDSIGVTHLRFRVAK